MVPRALTLVLLGACSYTPAVAPGDGQGGDGPPPDGPVSDLHLVFTEICVEGTAELVEIHNPTAAAIDLDTYYLTDINDYWKLPDAARQITVDSPDFLVRFPAGATIGAGATIVVAIDGPAFEKDFGTTPTFTLASMVEIVPPQSPQTPKLTDDGELLVLFEWDGQRDLVRDVDIVVHGRPSSGGNMLIAKEPVDGPDADSTPTAYAMDALSAMMVDRGPDDGRFSYKRVMLEASTEAIGGNGITGHDETSEDLPTTWNLGSMPRTPGTVDF